MKAIKLIWLAERLHLRRHGRLILNDQYYALKLGPVASKTINAAEGNSWADSTTLEYRNGFLRSVDENHFRSVTEVDKTQFSKTDLIALDEVLHLYGHLDQWQLSELSHLYPEWSRFEEELKANPRARFDIKLMDFFRAGKNPDEVLFNEDGEYLSLTKAIFAEERNDIDAE